MQNLLSTPLTLAEFKPTVLWPNFYFYQKTIGRQYDQNGISHLANSAVTHIFLFGLVPFGEKKLNWEAYKTYNAHLTLSTLLSKTWTPPKYGTLAIVLLYFAAIAAYKIIWLGK